jgi:hypothetical protein
MSTATRICVLIPLLSLATAGQSPASNWETVKALAPGTPIRLVFGPATKPVQGTLDSATDSGLVFRRGAGPESLPRAQVVSVSIRKENHRLRNTFIGLGAGTAAGILIGFGVGHAGCKNAGGWCDLNSGVGAAVGGVSGLVGGTLTGAFWPTGKWMKIYVT